MAREERKLARITKATASSGTQNPSAQNAAVTAHIACFSFMQ